MRKLDCNKIMCIIGIILIGLFCIYISKDYIYYINEVITISFYWFILIRALQFILPSVIFIYLYNQNTFVKESYYTVNSKKLSENLDYKIAHISDFHNTNSKRVHKNIVKKLEKNRPDIIVITGDLIDSRRTNINTAKNFMEKIAHIAPIYYVLGNHESRLENIQEYEQTIQKTGAIVLRNKKIQIEKTDDVIDVIGLDDPAFYITIERQDEINQNVNLKLQQLIESNNNFKILLTHRPEIIDVYAKNSVDLVFTGHAHGGQIRVPFVGGMFAPGQGYFPKYTNGIHEKNNTKVVISRGIGNSGFPFRINNRPELVFVTIVGGNRYENK